MREYRLCFVEGQKAYFTTKDIKKQWGDDWNDAPYEHNAGTPYFWREDSGEEKWDIIDLYFESELQTPDFGHSNSPYSVEDINKGQVAWLESPSYQKEATRVFAGTTIGEFLAVMKEIKGKVYLLTPSSKE